MCIYNIFKLFTFAVFTLLLIIVFISDFITINFSKVKYENKKQKIYNK